MLKLRLPPEWGIDPVPKEARTLRGFDYFFLWSSLGVGLLVLVAGSFLAGLTLVEVLALSVVGSLIGSLMLASAGVIGSRHGIPTMVSLRAVLGHHGSFAPTILNIVQLVGWTAFEIMIMAQAATAMTSGILGVAAFPMWVAVFGVWCMLLALGGPLVVVRKWLERGAIWLVYASTAWITYNVFISQNVGQWLFTRAEGALPLLLALDIVIAMPISWWPLISDYSRFASKPRPAFLGTLAGYTLSNTWFYLLGAALVAVIGLQDIISSIAVLFLGNAALILILVDETDNGFADIYSSAISFQNLFPKVGQKIFVFGVTAVGIALALTVPLLQYEGFLLLIGALFVPLLGVTSAEFFVNRRRRGVSVQEFYSQQPRFKLRNIAAWLIGIGIYVLITQTAPAIGASLPSFFISFAVSGLSNIAGRRELEVGGIQE